MNGCYHSLRRGTLKEDQRWEGREVGMLMSLVLHFDLETFLSRLRKDVRRQLGILVWSLEERPGWNHLSLESNCWFGN